MSEEMIYLIIAVPKKDISIEVSNIDYQKGDHWNPEMLEVDIEEVSVSGLDYEIEGPADNDWGALSNLAFERAQE